MNRIIIGDPIVNEEWIDLFWDKEVISLIHHHDIHRTDGFPTLDIIEFSREDINLNDLIQALQSIR